MSSLEQKLKSTIEQLEAERRNHFDRDHLENLKIKEKENIFSEKYIRKRKNAARKTEDALKHTRTRRRKEDALENNTIMAIIPMLYWGPETYLEMCWNVNKNEHGQHGRQKHLNSCDVYAEDGITFSEDVVFQIGCTGFTWPVLIFVLTSKSRSFYKQMSCHLKQFNFVVPEKPVKPSDEGKKRMSLSSVTL